MKVLKHIETTEFFYQTINLDLEVNILEESHRIMKKSYETEMYIDGNNFPLNNFVQETIGNIMMGFSKTLKGLDAAAPDLIEVKIKHLSKPADVDAHIYPVK
jgi:hypothetical protein